ncbi:MAG: hypothetical protein Q7T55_19530 [Solirubrobacteraceae bacterium]|nr:hypothetical protein [Solirubrobacteraceae bacterium]
MSAVDPSPLVPEPEPLAVPIPGRPDVGRVPWADHLDPLTPVPVPLVVERRSGVPVRRSRPPRLRWDRRTMEIRDEGVPYTFSIPLAGGALDHRAGRWIARRVNTLYAQTLSTTWVVVLVAAARPGQRLLVLVHRPRGSTREFDEVELRRYLDDTLTLLVTVAGHMVVPPKEGRQP